MHASGVEGSLVVIERVCKMTDTQRSLVTPTIMLLNRSLIYRSAIPYEGPVNVGLRSRPPVLVVGHD